MRKFLGLALTLALLIVVAGFVGRSADAAPRYTPSGTVIASWNGQQLYDDWTRTDTYGGGGCNAGGSDHVSYSPASGTTPSILRVDSTGAAGNCGEAWSPSLYGTTTGTVEGKIWIQANPAGEMYDWPAFWMSGPNWPNSGEIDAVEGLPWEPQNGISNSFTSYIYGINGAEHDWTTLPGGYDPGGVLSPVGPNFKPDSWVTVDIAFSPHEVQVYYNGVLYVTAEGSYVTNDAMNIILDVANQTQGQAATMSVEYVKVYN